MLGWTMLLPVEVGRGHELQEWARLEIDFVSNVASLLPLVNVLCEEAA